MLAPWQIAHDADPRFPDVSRHRDESRKSRADGSSRILYRVRPAVNWVVLNTIPPAQRVESRKTDSV
jgi:hypothetical protein